jgi:hypothetical protein
MRPNALLPALLTAVIAAPSAGCYTTWDIPVKELNHLDGYRASQPRVVTHQDGDDVIVDDDTQLRFRTGPSGPRLQAKFDAIDIHEGSAEWWLSGILHGDGQPLRVDLGKVTQVAVKRYSPGKTAITVLVPVITVAIVAGVGLGILFASIPDD